jgi:hypothetical protein
MPQVKNGYSKAFLAELSKMMVEWFGDQERWIPKSDSHWSIKEFLANQGISGDELALFCSRSVPFSDALKLCTTFQEVRYNRLVMEGIMPQTYGIFAAKNLLGYRDKQDLEVKGKVKSEISEEGLDRIAKRLFPKPKKGD